ncbi:MAG: transglutaminase domain-containing protein [Bacteroidales bacterium]|nr:transglutaminase domain-containing protein [Bacteroidales bacterium]
MKIIKNQFWLILLLVFISCNKSKIQKEEILKNLDSNERIGAEFLFREMEDKYTSDCKNLRNFYEIIDSVSLTDISYYDEKNLIRKFFDENSSTYTKKIYDINQIDNEYFINNIKQAYKYYSKPWNSYLSDSLFFEYVLPYRIGDEYIEDWRPFFQKKYGYILDSLEKTGQTITVELFANEILKVLKQREIHTLNTNIYTKSLRPSTLDKIKVGQCTDFTNYVIYVMRSFGIPCAKDGITEWHCWNSILLKDTIRDCYIETTFEDEHLKNWLYYVGWKNLPKIYRETFSKNPNSLAENCGSENIPSYFKNANLVDVSKEYYNGFDIEIESKNSVPNKNFGYLKVWNNKFQFVDWAKIENNKCKFYNISDSVVYFPSYYVNSSSNVPFAYPFVITSEGRKDFVPRKDSTQQLVLYRKYFIKRAHNVFLIRMQNGYFLGANNEDFSDSTMIYEIKDLPNMKWNEVELKEPKKFKYIKYVSPIWSWLNVGEIEFYNSNNEKVTGKIIGCEDFSADDLKKENAFDGDVLTYVDAINPHYQWLGVEFTEPTEISKIRFIPRNDDNFVQEGQEYELVYADVDGWKSMGKQIAQADSLIYDNVPSNAIYLLKNLTKGHEERIFEYKKSKQIFW